MKNSFFKKKILKKLYLTTLENIVEYANINKPHQKYPKLKVNL
jgi:hypothetical protein